MRPDQVDRVPDRVLAGSEVRAEADVRTDTTSRPAHNSFLTDALIFCSPERGTIGITQVTVSIRVVFAVAAASVLAVGPSGAGASSGTTVVRLRPGAACTAPAPLVAGGATAIDAELRLWRVPSSLVPGLRARGAVAASQPERTYEVARSALTPDPLETDE
jgi:hypothetical protein